MNQNYNSEFQNNINNETNNQISNVQMINNTQNDNNFNNMNQEQTSFSSNNHLNNNPKKNNKLLIIVALVVICLVVVAVILLLNKTKENNSNNNTNDNSSQATEKNDNNSIPVAMPDKWDWNVWNNALKYVSSNTKNLSEDYMKFTFDKKDYSFYTLTDFLNKELEIPYDNQVKNEYQVKYNNLLTGIFSVKYEYYEGIENEFIHRPTKAYMKVSFDGSWHYGKDTLNSSCTKCFKENDDWFNIFNSLYLKNGVTIGQTESEVIKILGTPIESNPGDDEGDMHDTFTIYKDDNITINNLCDFDKGRLTIITITIDITNIPSSK